MFSKVHVEVLEALKAFGQMSYSQCLGECHIELWMDRVLRRHSIKDAAKLCIEDLCHPFGLPEISEGPKDYISIRNLHSGSKAKVSGNPETIVCRILINYVVFCAP